VVQHFLALLGREMTVLAALLIHAQQLAPTGQYGLAIGSDEYGAVATADSTNQHVCEFAGTRFFPPFLKFGETSPDCFIFTIARTA
jgi:hypothetical protein